ncbi:MAG: MFS transporter, partial [Rhodococcus sp. (in: high G+C Gram-positive bacteria)]
PIMTAALQTLDDASVARGSSLMNIIQQSAGSIGTAVISVVLTNQLLNRPAAGPAVAAGRDPSIAAQLSSGDIETGLAQAADAFGNTFLVATIIVAFTFVPAMLLPRKKFGSTSGGGQGAATAMMH